MPAKLKALIVDDELPARERLMAMISKFEDFEKVEGASSGEEALSMLPEYKPDVVFLDIQMPDMDGISLARELVSDDEPPMIVFVTAYDKYAIDAFEVNAIDYILKPANQERLQMAVERLKGILGTKETKGQFIDELSVALGRIVDKSEEKLTRLTIVHEETGNRMIVEPEELWWIYAKGDKTYTRVQKGEFRIYDTLANLSKRLPSDIFVRTHKAYIVNIKHIQEVIPWFSGTYNLKMKDQATELPLSRSFVAVFKEKVGWI
ncbi:MAG: LytTR family DNA-binding domain-containing protein [Candidatus Eremiobacteraeota bacterium]|nr:LytTR family DNA-binding domain-containing protein [Candidatus Eremiobacteraeota bacterium]